MSAWSESGSWDSSDIEEWETIDALLLKGRAESENRCPPKISGRFPWSPELGSAGKWLSYWKLRILLERTKTCNQSRLQNLQIILQVPTQLSGILPFEKLVTEAQSAQKRFTALKKEALGKRQQHLDAMGRLAGALHKCESSAASRRIEASEKASRQYRTLRSIFRDGQSSGFDRLDIPDSYAVLRKDEPIPRISLVVQEEIEAVLLPHTVRRFQQHKETPFGMGERGRRLGSDCTSPDAKALSDGTYDYRLLELSEEAREWLLQLKKRDYVGVEGVICTQVTTAEWIRGWARMRESTASAPGAGHYGHYKSVSVVARLPETHEDHSTVLADVYAPVRTRYSRSSGVSS